MHIYFFQYWFQKNYKFLKTFTLKYFLHKKHQINTLLNIYIYFWIILIFYVSVAFAINMRGNCWERSKETCFQQLRSSLNFAGKCWIITCYLTLHHMKLYYLLHHFNLFCNLQGGVIGPLDRWNQKILEIYSWFVLSIDFPFFPLHNFY